MVTLMLPEYSGQYPDLFRHHCIRQKSSLLMIVCQLQIVKLSVEKQELTGRLRHGKVSSLKVPKDKYENNVGKR